MRTRKTDIAGMRDLLSFLEDNPEIPMPRFGVVDSFVHDVVGVDTLARIMAPCRKKVVGNFFVLVREFGSVKLEVNFNREEVCERVVVGTKEIPKETIEAHTQDIIEWKCPDGVLRPT